MRKSKENLNELIIKRDNSKKNFQEKGSDKGVVTEKPKIKPQPERTKK